MLRMFKTIVLIAIAASLAPATAGAQDWRTISSEKQFLNENALRVNVEYGAGKLSIEPGTDRSLYKATLRYDANVFRPRNRYAEGMLNIGIEGGNIRGRNMKSGRLDLVLGTAVPIDLDLKFGAVEADLELGGLRIRSASFQTGASDTRINVSKANRENCSSATFEVGAAQFKATGLGNLNCED